MGEAGRIGSGSPATCTRRGGVEPETAIVTTRRDRRNPERGLAAEIHSPDVLALGELATRALEPVPSEFEDVASIGDLERPSGILLDQHDGEAASRQRDDLVEHLVDEMW